LHQAREGTTRDHDTQRFPYVLNTAGLKKPDEANDDGAERQTEHGANGDPDEAIAQAVTWVLRHRVAPNVRNDAHEQAPAALAKRRCRLRGQAAWVSRACGREHAPDRASDDHSQP